MISVFLVPGLLPLFATGNVTSRGLEGRVAGQCLRRREEAPMKTITARVLDPTHLELSQAIDLPPGESIQITLPEPGEDWQQWREAARRRFLDAYDAGDAIYDAL